MRGLRQKPTISYPASSRDGVSQGAKKRQRVHSFGLYGQLTNSRPKGGGQSVRIEKELDCLHHRPTENVRGTHGISARPFGSEHCQADGRRRKRRTVVRPVADHRRAFRAELLHQPPFVHATANGSRLDTEILGDLLQRSEGVGGDEQDADVTPKSLEHCTDAVQKAPTIGDRAVDVEDDMVQGERWPARNLDLQTHQGRSAVLGRGNPFTPPPPQPAPSAWRRLNTAHIPKKKISPAATR